jgi:predicted TIM-barrel fold metal-dependent hydrolase
VTVAASEITALRPEEIRAATGWTGPIIDGDVHAVVPGISALQEYLSIQWREFILERGMGEPFNLPTVYPPNAPTTADPRWRPADGRTAASDPALLREHVLDPLDVQAAMLHCYYGVDSIRYPDFSAALASAVNDWLIERWLDADPRLHGSIAVPARYPDAMVREIERVAAHPRIVQVYLPVRSDRLYGNRIWHPMFEAIVRHRLVAAIHWGGTSEGPPSPTGWPSWFVEEYAAEQQAYMAQLTSMVGEGLFQRFPELRLTVGEIGFAWLPSLMWRLTKEWKGLRRDVPWVAEPPADLLRRHVRFTTSPLDAGPPEQMARIVEWLGSDDLLMFATDYPHRHDDDIRVLLDAVSEPARERLMAGTARDWYRLDGAGGVA